MDKLQLAELKIKKLNMQIRELKRKLNQTSLKGHCLWEGAPQKKCPYEVRIK